MFPMPMEIVDMCGETLAKVAPITLVLAIVFTVLSHFWACNPGKAWWQKTELVTDICYWFFIPLLTRVVRIGLLVLGAAVIFNIHDAGGLIAFTTMVMVRWPKCRYGRRPSSFSWYPTSCCTGSTACIMAAGSGNTTRFITLRKIWVDLRGALSSGQPVSRHGRRRCRAVDGRHLA